VVVKGNGDQQKKYNKEKFVRLDCIEVFGNSVKNGVLQNIILFLTL
jgi:hypothetical protein